MHSEMLQKLIDKDSDLILHPASSIAALCEQGPDMIVKGKGAHVYDAKGTKLLDAIAGLWCVNVGYGRMELSQVMKEAADELAYYHTFSNASNPWQVMLAEKILSYTPAGLSKVFLGNTGSDANDTLIKIAWHYHTLRGKPEKIKIIARDQAYHGTSISTAGLTGLPSFHKSYPLPLDFILRTDCPHYYTRGHEGESEAQFCDRLISNVAKLIDQEGAETIAAFFAEPIHAAGGIIEPPAGYYPKLRQLLDDNDILLVADEVVCGFGRLGEWFGSSVVDMEPDMMSCAKGLTSGYFPMSASIISQKIWEVLHHGSQTLGGFYHGYTYSGHPVGCAVGLANLHILEQEGLVNQAREQGRQLHGKLRRAFSNHDRVGEIRGRGLLAGIQLVADKQAQALPDAALKWPHKVAAAARDRGVIVRPLPSVGTVALSPPLTFTDAQIDTLIDVLAESIDQI